MDNKAEERQEANEEREVVENINEQVEKENEKDQTATEGQEKNRKEPIGNVAHFILIMPTYPIFSPNL